MAGQPRDIRIAVEAGRDSFYDGGPSRRVQTRGGIRPSWGSMNQPVTEIQGLGYSRRWILFAAVSVLFGLSMFYRSAIAVLTTDLMRDVPMDMGALGLVSAAFFYTYALFQIPGGLLLDRFSPAKVMAAFYLFGPRRGDPLFDRRLAGRHGSRPAAHGGRHGLRVHRRPEDHLPAVPAGPIRNPLRCRRLRGKHGHRRCHDTACSLGAGLWGGARPSCSWGSFTWR